jgi:hypothetical protein
MGAACSQMEPEAELEKKRQMVQVFRALRGYGRTRYIQRPCEICKHQDTH